MDNHVKFLVEQTEVNVNCVNNEKETPLHLCARFSSTDMVKYLVELGADGSCKNEYGDTLLHYAVQSDSMATAEYVVKDLGLEINSKNCNDETPLHVAARSDSLKIVKYLVENNAGLDYQNCSGETPFLLAAQSDSTHLAEYLMERGSNVKNVKRLVDSEWANKEYVDSKNCNGNTALFLAAQSGFTNIVKYLVKQGAVVDCRNNNHDTLLHWSIQSEDPLVIIKYVVELHNPSIDVNSKNVEGNTTLHLAARFGFIDCVEYLVDNGADVNSENIFKDRPLHYAGSQEIFDFLIERGAVKDCRNSFGESPEIS